ncbi:hypothetical protein H4219_002899 [Mycoemilia scoparia]|uniref:ER membrane protein complex subunit 1 n=1 Tax=Mycoemilia scoparia TaxID=417184 RepID=A0A9W8A2T5_9FUNG|nr:hypothetical protein H4219_002899 [Mycoemilia scoparia]
MRGLALVFLANLLLFSAVESVYQDEAGTIDWHHKQVGIPKATHVDEYDGVSRIFVATERNVLASIDPRDGGILWRYMFEENDLITSLKVYKSHVLTTSGNNHSTNIRVWDSNTSRLVWDAQSNVPLQDQEGHPNVSPAVFLPDGGDVVAIIGSKLYRYNGNNGEVKWQSDLPQKKKKTHHRHLELFGSRIFIISDIVQKAGSKGTQKALMVAEVDSKTGSVSYRYELETGNRGVDSKNLVIVKSKATGAHIVWRAEKDILWNIHTLGQNSPTRSIHHAKMLQSELWPKDMLTSELAPVLSSYETSEPARFVCSYTKDSRKKAFVVAINPNSNPAPGEYDIILKKDLEYAIPKHSSAIAAKLPSKNLPGGKLERGYMLYQARIIPNSNKESASKYALSIRRLNTKSGDTVLEHTLPYDQEKHGGIYRISPLESSGADTDKGLPSILIETTDGMLILANSSNIVWERDESLAHADNMVFVELPEKRRIDEAMLVKSGSGEPGYSIEDPDLEISPLTRYILRWARHISQLASFITGGTVSSSLPGDGSTGNPKSGREPSGLVRDTFGFRKLAIYSTSKGQIAALDTLDGKQIWRKHISYKSSRVKVEYLFLTRTTHSGSNPQITLVARSSGDGSAKVTKAVTIVATFDALDGTLVGRSVIAEPVVKAVDLQVETHKHQKVIGLVIHKGKEEYALKLWPTTKDAYDAVSSVAQKLYFILGDVVGSSSINGYQLDVPADADSLDSTNSEPIQIHPVWRLGLAPGESIVSILNNLKVDRVASLGRVLGDRSVLYKYLNPNMLAFVSAKPGEPGFTINLVDQVSGHILHTTQHNSGVADEAHKVLGIHCENWVVYQYWQTQGPEDPQAPKEAATSREKAKQIQSHNIVAMELYESDAKDERLDTKAFSSFDPLIPHVISQAYTLSEPITAIGATITHNGIAVHDALLGLASQKLASVSQVLLDPRRPVKSPTNDEKAENLVPYAPTIQIDPKKGVLSHDLPVLGIKSIVSSPAHLESTSIITAYGLDIFVTRTSPSGTFDMLSQSFSKANLVITMAALLVGCVIATPVVRRKGLSAAWK